MTQPDDAGPEGGRAVAGRLVYDLRIATVDEATFNELVALMRDGAPSKPPGGPCDAACSTGERWSSPFAPIRHAAGSDARFHSTVYRRNANHEDAAGAALTGTALSARLRAPTEPPCRRLVPAGSRSSREVCHVAHL